MTSYKELLQLLIDRQLKQEEAFQTTDFWEYATNELSKILINNEIHRFRSDPACLTYFVPTYGHPAMGLTVDQIAEISKISDAASVKQRNTISNFVTGYSHATADHRVIQACVTGLGKNPFKNFDESPVGQPLEQFIFDGNRCSRPTHNYMLGLLFLLSHDPDLRLNSVVELGGGHGALGEILFKSELDVSQYVNFDIPPTCIFAEYYLNQIFQNQLCSNLNDIWRDEIQISDLNGLHVRPNWDIQNLAGPIDLFVNYHSFQEMEPTVVKRYLDEIVRLEPSYLLLRNIREGKQKKVADGLGVETPTTSQDYVDWLSAEFKLVGHDSQTFGFVTADNFHSELSLWKRH